MKKRILSVALVAIMLICSVPLAYATNYQGTYTESVTIKKGDTIDSGAVFRGAVTIEKNATVSCGTFYGDVTVNTASTLDIIGGDKPAVISGGTFYGAVYNGGAIKQGEGLQIKMYGDVTNSATLKLTVDSGIYSGTFSGSGTISNTKDCYIYGGTFTKEVTNAGNISGGEFDAKVTNASTGSITLLGSAVFNRAVDNNGTIAGCTFRSTVTNNSKITGGSFYGCVTNNSSITGGSFYNIIKANGGTIDSNVSALVLTRNAYTVMNYATIKSRVDMSGSNSTFTLPQDCTFVNDVRLKNQKIIEWRGC